MRHLAFAGPPSAGRRHSPTKRAVQFSHAPCPVDINACQEILTRHTPKVNGVKGTVLGFMRLLHPAAGELQIAQVDRSVEPDQGSRAPSSSCSGTVMYRTSMDRMRSTVSPILARQGSSVLRPWGAPVSGPALAIGAGFGSRKGRTQAWWRAVWGPGAHS